MLVTFLATDGKEKKVEFIDERLSFKEGEEIFNLSLIHYFLKRGICSSFFFDFKNPPKLKKEFEGNVRAIRIF